MKELTATTLGGMTRALCKRYGATVRSKEDSAFMRELAALLAALGIQDRDTFLHKYSLTLGHNIYLCFAVGDTGRRAPTLLSQLMTVAHELEHVVLYDAAGAVAYDAGYLDSAQRAICEARCYLVNLEVYALYTRATTGKLAVFDINLAPILAAYGCGKVDVRAAHVVLDKGARVVAKGGINTAAAQAVGRWFGWA